MAITQHPEIDRALQLAADRQATDVFLLPGEPLSLRIRDQIERTDSPPLSPDTVCEIAVAALGPERVAAVPTTGYASTNCSLAGVTAGQLTVTSAGGRLAITIRIIPSHIPTVEDIALPQSVLDAAGRKSGVILFSGHVGSGKTTTACSLLAHLNATQSKLICTVEEPVAYAFTSHRPLILQREIGIDVPDTIAGISASVVQDADVIFVGEIRSPDDARACVNAAGLSRLVITQTHARTALRALHRLIDIQPPDRRDTVRRQLADHLAASVAQTLLPRAGGIGKVAAYDVLTPDAEFRRVLADGRNPIVRSTPLAHSLSITDHLRTLAESGTIAQSTADAAIADYLPLVDPSFWT